EPEAGDLRLIGGPNGADLAADVLHLVVVARVRIARQRGRAGKPELRGRQQREGRDVDPARIRCRLVAASHLGVGDGRGWRERGGDGGATSPVPCPAYTVHRGSPRRPYEA